jgi:hypothetical protein
MTYLTLVGLMGVWDCSSPYFSTPLHRMLVKQVELRQLCSSRKNSFQRRHGVVGKLPTMPLIMKK